MDLGDGLARHTNTFGYDPDSHLTSVSNPAATGVSDGFAYDNAGRLTSVESTKFTWMSRGPYFEDLTEFAYGRDATGQVTSATAFGVPGDNHTYGYTKLNQLQSDSAATDRYGYDAADNLAQRADGTVQAFDAGNQLTAGAGITVVGTGGAANSASNALTATLPAGVAANDQILVAVTLAASESFESEKTRNNQPTRSEVGT